jgi:hypothetical protein
VQQEDLAMCDLNKMIEWLKARNAQPA